MPIQVIKVAAKEEPEVCVWVHPIYFVTSSVAQKKKSVPQMIENVCDNHFLFNLFLGSLVPLPVSFIIDACGMQR